MPMLLQYHLSDGLIRAHWSSNTPELLAAQIPADDTTYGYLLTSAELDFATLQREYRVQEGELVAKQRVTLTGMPNPFAADSDSQCHVAVLPFVPCTLLVNLTPQVLTEADQTVVLTSDVPHTFQIVMQAQAQAWAEPLTVEAR